MGLVSFWLLVLVLFLSRFCFAFVLSVLCRGGFVAIESSILVSDEKEREHAGHIE
jgi:hypothetical protein